MNLATLARRARAGQVNELELFSMEGGFYLLRVHTAEGSELLHGEQGKVMHLRSTTHLRDLLHDLQLPPLPCVLVQHVVHDEMCGRRDGPIEPLRLPVNLERQW
ncbi:DUF6482 family protein [Pseudomonas sp. DTU_2021_1001937_2_SI_NGA_ILE_001]|uniref:DUF6482 family protein n=1 Tax=Pseudomonas sp. DTU_2021_1001937_2_SI_NGA_ILE_001 TaxID=3077589 RepID=UPI0025FB7586|nr:DUF6482 family protein [Pseudomonas sp. DTU_2021_1001937_2_SI_NGA_ILE_001]WNW10282.1 DUF6482 family protein [Pseudomonas sp. DTU_2021_1001937_2_SI_NGA_ILE_001]